MLDANGRDFATNRIVGKRSNMTKKLATGHAPESRIDWFDRRIITTVLRWAPYGGLDDEEVFPEFGFSAAQLVERFRKIVVRLHRRQRTLTCYDRELLVMAINHLIQPTRDCAIGARRPPDVPETRDGCRN